MRSANAPLLITAVCVCFLGGCGTVGPPVAPEMVGVGAKLQKDKDKERLKEEERRKARERQEMMPAEPVVPPEEAESKPEEEEETLPETASGDEEVILPPLRPIGVPPGSLPEQ